MLSEVAWGDVPGWVGAVSSLAALAAASVAAVVAHRVFRLEQSRDEDQVATQQSAQASKIAAWPSVVLSDPVDHLSATVWGAALRNGSDLPIYQVHVNLVSLTDRGETAVVLEVVPPGDWLLSGSELYPRPSEPLMRAEARGLPPPPYVVDLTFSDSAGQGWHRDRKGLLSRSRTNPTRP